VGGLSLHKSHVFMFNCVEFGEPATSIPDSTVPEIEQKLDYFSIQAEIILQNNRMGNGEDSAVATPKGSKAEVIQVNSCYLGAVKNFGACRFNEKEAASIQSERKYVSR